jgi:hypothetical protein
MAAQLLAAAFAASSLTGQKIPPDRAWLFTYALNASIAGSARDTGGVVLDVAIWRGTARITVRSGALRAITGDGGTLLLRSADSTITVLNPAKHDALTGQAQDLSRLLGGPIGGMQVEVSDAASATRVRGIGPRLLGFATRRVELVQHYTLKIGNATARRSLRTEQVVQLDVSREIARLDPGFRAFAEYFARSLGVPGVVRTALRAAERDLPAGFPMQSVNTSVSVSGADTVRTETHGAVSAFRTEAVDTTSFRVPGGYRITDMNRLLQSRPRTPPPAARPP